MRRPATEERIRRFMAGLDLYADVEAELYLYQAVDPGTLRRAIEAAVAPPTGAGC